MPIGNELYKHRIISLNNYLIQFLIALGFVSFRCHSGQLNTVNRNKENIIKNVTNLNT